MTAITRFTQLWFPGRAYGIFTPKTSAEALDIKQPQIQATNFDKQIKATNFDKEIEATNFDKQINWIG